MSSPAPKKKSKSNYCDSLKKGINALEVLSRANGAKIKIMKEGKESKISKKEVCDLHNKLIKIIDKHLCRPRLAEKKIGAFGAPIHVNEAMANFLYNHQNDLGIKSASLGDLTKALNRKPLYADIRSIITLLELYLRSKSLTNAKATTEFYMDAEMIEELHDIVVKAVKNGFKNAGLEGSQEEIQYLNYVNNPDNDSELPPVEYQKGGKKKRVFNPTAFTRNQISALVMAAADPDENITGLRAAKSREAIKNNAIVQDADELREAVEKIKPKKEEKEEKKKKKK